MHSALALQQALLVKGSVIAATTVTVPPAAAIAVAGTPAAAAVSSYYSTALPPRIAALVGLDDRLEQTALPFCALDLTPHGQVLVLGQA